MGFELVNNDGAVVLLSISTDSEPESWPRLKTGYNALECCIPSGLLNAGRYLVRARFGRWGERTAHPDESVSFEAYVSHAVSPQPQLPRPGVIIPILQWSTAEVEKGQA
jgi:hypothetical protein